MTEITIKLAVSEAKRFLKAANEVLENSVKPYSVPGGRSTTYLDTGKRTGALRRSSLDLTRALAEMRRPG